MVQRLIIVLGLTLAFARAGLSAEFSQPSGVGCLEEVQRVCHASGAELDICLQTRGAEFSNTCRKQVWEAEVMMHDQEGPAACASDMQLLCPGPSVKSIQKCLAQRIQELPERCRTL